VQSGWDHALLAGVIAVSLPARINVVGSPSDAAEGAYATISAAVEPRGGADIGPDTGLTLRRGDGAAARFDAVPIVEHRGFAVEAAAVNALCRAAPDLPARIAARGAAIRTWTDIPASSGLGGSSVLLLAVLTALRAYYALDPRRWNDYVLAELAQRAEEHDLGVVCGYADRYAPLFGDVAYVSYHGKLWHAPLGDEPYATYEKLGAYAPPLQFVVATTGVQRESGAVHGPMRARYLEERRRGDGPLLEVARQIGATAWRGKIALLAGDLPELGRQMDRNQELVDEMMTRCGFSTGAGAEVRELVAAARGAGALGAKLTGAGGGGAIFALPGPTGADALADALRAAGRRLGLGQSEVFVTAVSPTGLQVRTASASAGRSADRHAAGRGDPF
jgi:galactokinase/mevalonate kinase-like predicted kinase